MKTGRLLFFIAIMLFAGQAFSQTLYDVLYLKNGSKLTGTIIEQQPGSSIKFKDLKNNIYLFKPEEIDRMAREAATPEKPEKQAFVFDEVRKAKWFLSIHAGYCGAPVEYRENGYYNGYSETGGYETMLRHMASIQVSAGYRINPNIWVGASGGAVVNNRLRLVPVMAEGSFAFLKKRVSPFLNVGVGYAFGLRDPQQEFPKPGGVAATARIGVKYYVVKELALLFDVGYRGQQRYAFFMDRWFHGGEVRAGFIF